MVTMKRKISDLKVAELRAELEKRGLESKGLKGVLVQRLQKAIEDEGGNSSEVEFSGGEVSSPKTTGRRSTQRGKRTTAGTGEVDSEPSQEEEKEGTPKPETDEAASVLEREKEEEASTNDDGGDQIDADEKIEKATNEQSENNDVPENGAHHEDDSESDNEPVSESEVADDATPTRDEEGDALSPSEYHEAHDDGEGENEQGDEDVTEETFVSADSTMEVEEPAGNDYRDEEDETEYQVEEEEAELHDDEDDDPYEEGGDESEMVTLEEAHDGEGAEEESDAGPAAVEEEIEQAEEEEEKTQEIEPETKIQSEPVEDEQQQQEDISVDAVIKPETENMETETTAEITTEQKPKSEAGVKDEVSAEVDYLDMLDYDLEPPGEHSTISTPSEEQSGKSDLATDDKSIEKGDEKNDNNAEEKTATTTEDRKSRPNSDSSKPSNSDQSKSGGQSSSKSGNTAGKDGGKASSSGKRDGSTSSAASKKDDNPNKNLWISGLSSTTRASELKSAFSRYGKVIGAKVVTNVKSPGSRCYGYVTMASADAASKCILHLNNTEMHGRMITVEIAKGDPSATSRKQAASGGSAKKDSDSKDASKSKDSDSKPGSTSSRRSSTAQASGKDGAAADGKDQAEGDKKSQQDSKSREGGQAARRNTTDEARKGGKSKSPARDRSRAERNSTSGPRSGDKRHQGRPGRSEPDRKRPRPQNAADRKVVMDSHKGELRVNVSRTAGGPNRTARWQGEPKPRPLLSRRRSGSPVRRRSFSPMRGSALSRTGGARGGRGGRGGKAGLITRQGATYEDRNAARAHGPHGQILSFSEIRAQQRKGAGRGGRGGGLSRGDLAADRERLRRERDEREKLRFERERLERERRQLEKDRQERERLEQERIRLEQERKRELERIEREKAEMRRLQEITRYEVEQRQRAIKRTYDNDSGSHRSGRTGGPSSGRDRPDARSDARRGGDDRRYVNHGRGGPTRNGPANEPPPPGTTEYRSRQGAYRGSGNSGPDNRGKPGAGFDSRRGAQDSRQQSDSRYTGGSAGGRTVEKYDRRGGEPAGRGAEFSQSHGFGRNAEQTGQRRSGPQAGRDGRKVVRDRPAEHRSGTSPEYRRTGGRGSAGGRVEITREQSPPARRPRRDASPPSGRGAPPSGRGGPPSSSRNGGGGSWRDSGKGVRDTSTRRGGPEDRDLREQIRGRQESYSESSRDRGNTRREGRGNRSPEPSRSSGQFQGGWPETAGGAGSAQQIYPVGADASAIPTQTGRGASNTAWGHVQQWQQNAAGARAWAGAAIPTAPSTVNRQIIPPYGAVPTALIAPPGAMIAATQGYDRQSRSFQNSYNQKPIQRRF